MIPHKYRKYRAILDLSFELRLAGYALLLVNKATEHMALVEAMDQIGTVLPRITEALAAAPIEEGPIMFSKLDIKDEFWRMTCAEGEEWNFTYVLPNNPGEPIQTVVPSALQMGWAESPPFFCVALETVRDVAETYMSERVGTLPAHPLEKGTMPPEAAIDERLLQVADMRGNEKTTFLQMSEVYVDDFIQMAQPQDPTILRHCTRAVMHGIHSMFPPPEVLGHSGEDPISQKKLRDGEGL